MRNTVLPLLCLMLSTASAHASVENCLQEIDSATRTVESNSRIYQWKRVDREMVDITSCVRRLHRKRDLTQEEKDDLTTLDTAVGSLKSAAYHHSPDQVTKAAGTVLDACKQLVEAAQKQKS